MAGGVLEGDNGVESILYCSRYVWYWLAKALCECLPLRNGQPLADLPFGFTKEPLGNQLCIRNAFPVIFGSSISGSSLLISGAAQPYQRALVLAPPSSNLVVAFSPLVMSSMPSMSVDLGFVSKASD